MPYTNEMELTTSKIMALLIGAPGKGKTLAGASFAEAGPMEFADFDGRMKPVRLYYPKARISYEPFDMKNMESFAYTYLPKLLNNWELKSFQLAGLTSLSTTAISYQMHQIRGGDTMKKTKGGLMVPSWDQFNGEAMIIGQVLDMLKALKCNVFVEAHPVTRTDIVTGSKYTSLVAFGPKVESLVPGYFDEIWYFDTRVESDGSRSYICRTRPSSDAPMAKTSLPLPAEIKLSDDNGKPLSLYRIIKECLDNYKEEDEVIQNVSLSEFSHLK